MSTKKKEFHFKTHATIGFISLIFAGIFSCLALNSTIFFSSLTNTLYGGQELEPFTDVSDMLAMDSTYQLFAFLFIISVVFNGWRCAKLDE